MGTMWVLALLPTAVASPWLLPVVSSARSSFRFGIETTVMELSSVRRT